MGKIILNGKEYGGSGGSGGHTIVDPDGTDMPQENKLQFTGAVNVSDDSVNGQTVVDVEGGGNYYLNTIYSTEEKKIGYWTNSKPLYQKTVVLNNLSVTNNQWAKTNESANGIETIADGFLIDNQSPSQTFQCDIGVDGGKIAVLTWFVGNSARTMSYLTFRYTKTTDIPESNPQTGGVIYLPTIYSEEEREIGCFVGGKPLYQKTIPFTTDSGSNATNYAHGIANIDTVASYSGVIVRADGTSIDINDSRWQGTAEDLVGCVVGKTSISVFVNYVGYRNLPVYVTIQYTKTTDVAGSGSWTPSGANAVHYSTNEQVIGTWIDGKPLYEKTVSFGALPNSTSKSVAHGISDLDKIVDFSALAKRPSPFNIIPLPSSHYQSTSAQQEISFNATNITIRNGNNASAYTDVYVTLRYTKTTD